MSGSRPNTTAKGKPDSILDSKQGQVLTHTLFFSY